MSAPVTYIPDFLVSAGYEADYVGLGLFDDLWNGLSWVQRDAPRRECWMNDFMAPYTYGSGDFSRTYDAVSWNNQVSIIRDDINRLHGAGLNCCFVNGYEDERQHLGWHADDSPEIDHARPIAVISLGAERDIMFGRKIINEKGKLDADPDTVERLRLGHGSLLLMHPGMQQTHIHRIPKVGHKTGPRISLTYRGLLAKDI